MARPPLWMELLIVLAIFAITNGLSAVRQKQNTFNGGLAWEAPYYTMAQQIAQRQPVAAEGPYVYRLGTPWLAARFSPQDLFRGFRWVNFLGNLLTTILLVFWLRRYLQQAWVRIAMITLFLIQWDAPPRLLYHSPVHVDAWLYVFLVGGLLAIERYRHDPKTIRLITLAALSFTGVLFREVAMLVPLALLAIGNPLQWRPPGGAPRFCIQFPPWPLTIPLTGGLLAFVLCHLVAQKTDGYSFLQTILWFLYEKTFIRYTHGWLLAFGPILFLLLYHWQPTLQFLREHQHLALYLLAGAGLGYIGGTDTERLLYWTMPVIYVLVGRVLEDHRGTLRSPWLVVLLIIGQVLTSRILFTTPDYPNEASHSFPILQQFGNDVPYLDLFSWHGFRTKEALSYLQFVLFGAVILWWMHRNCRTAVSRRSRSIL